jgi:hypothetical protein
MSAVLPPAPETAHPQRKNASAWQRYNRRRWRLERFVIDPDEPAPFICECTSADCLHALELTMREYEDAHRQPDLLAVLPGHVLEDDCAQVIEERPRFWIVELGRFPNGPWSR